MKAGRVGHLNVCPWPWCRRLIRGGQHLTRDDAFDCDQYITLPTKRGGTALVVIREDFEAWEASI